MRSPATTASQAEQAVTLVRDADPAAALLHPQRRRILENVIEPDSAAGVARRLGAPRQQVNYHLRELERVGLVELVAERRRGNCSERVVRATARRYVISPEVLGELGDAPEGLRDHFSWDFLVVAAGRAIRDLGRLRDEAEQAGKRLATMTMESELRFASAADRDSFARELTEAVARLVRTYHDTDAESGRRFKLLLAAYPSQE